MESSSELGERCLILHLSFGDSTSLHASSFRRARLDTDDKFHAEMSDDKVLVKILSGHHAHMRLLRRNIVKSLRCRFVGSEPPMGYEAFLGRWWTPFV